MLRARLYSIVPVYTVLGITQFQITRKEYWTAWLGKHLFFYLFFFFGCSQTKKKKKNEEGGIYLTPSLKSLITRLVVAAVVVNIRDFDAPPPVLIYLKVITRLALIIRRSRWTLKLHRKAVEHHDHHHQPLRPTLVHFSIFISCYTVEDRRE